MDMNDITTYINGTRVNVRAGAIVTQGDEVLLVRMTGKDWWFLPGGRIRTGESSLEALKRELVEEIGESYRIVGPLICSENFFGEGDWTTHEICTYYEVEWLAGRELHEAPGAPEIFKWVRRDQMHEMDLKPSFLKEKLANPPESLELVIYRDGESQ